MKQAIFFTVLLAISCLSCSQPTENTHYSATVEATVNYQAPEMAIGGEVDPTGFTRHQYLLYLSE